MGPKSHFPLMLASPNMEAKSFRVSRNHSNTANCYWSRILISLWKKNIAGLVLRLGSNVLFNPTRDTSPKLHLQKVLTCKHPFHIWDLGSVWSSKSQLPCSKRLRLHELISSGLGLGTLCDMALNMITLLIPIQWPPPLNDDISRKFNKRICFVDMPHHCNNGAVRP
jgi:hypothetical protein